MDHSLWSVLLKLVNNKTATLPQKPDGQEEAIYNPIYAIEQMIGNSNPQQHFNGLDEKTKKSIWYILGHL
jgi:hypothetical protein